MYIPKSQYRKLKPSDLASFYTESDFLEINPKPLFLLSTGDVYAISEEDLQAGRFENGEKIEDPFGEILPSSTSENSIITPTEKDYQIGYYSRYFISNTIVNKITEVSKERIQKSLEKYERAISIPWILRGPVKDQNINGIFYEGAGSKNKKAVNEGTKLMPGLNALLLDFGQYVADYQTNTEFDPTLNSDPGIIIPAPSKKSLK